MKFSQFFVTHPELLYMIQMISPLLLTFPCLWLPWSITPFYAMVTIDFFYSLLRLMSLDKIDLCIAVWFLYTFAPVSFTVVNKMDRNLLKVSFNPLNTSLTCPGSPAPWSMIALYACANIDNKYNLISYLYWSAQPYVFSHIVSRYTKQVFMFCNISIICLMCVDVVAESCLLS